MREYIKPEAKLEIIEIEEIMVTSSGNIFGGEEPGDSNSPWPF